MSDPLLSLGNKNVPQSKPTEPTQVQNNAGGFVFETSDEQRFLRFLILGTTGGTYYQFEQQLTEENAKEILAIMNRLGARFVEIIKDVSLSGRAAKQNTTLWSLALASVARHPDGSPNLDVRKAAYNAIKDVCRTGTMLFQFIGYTRTFQGGGQSRGFRQAISAWYNDKEIDKVSRQVAKYANRANVTHRDAIMLAHPKPSTTAHSELYSWIVGKGETPEGIIAAFEEAKRSDNVARVIELINTYGLEREMINQALLSNPLIWDALLPNMGMMAKLRNLNRMTTAGLLSPGSQATKQIIESFSDPEAIARSRIHPMSVLLGMRTYSSGHGHMGKLSWNPVRQIVDVLDAMFYTSFGNVEPTNKPTLLALDVSGSMMSPIMGAAITCREASAAMALITANVEPDYTIVGFTSAGGKSWYNNSAVQELSISPRRRLDDVIKSISRLPFGATDCALPMLWAMQNRTDIENFAIYTDNETWAGSVHPHRALADYRNKCVSDARFAAVAMSATRYSVSNPADPDSMDVVGFDAATPQILSDFFARRI